MMTIQGVNGTQFPGTNNNRQTDSVSKSIQNQIENAQKKLQELSSNTEMPLEEKMEKRQQIQQDIASLNQQLRQHQINQRRNQPSRDTSIADLAGVSQQTKKPGNKGTGLSQAHMQAMISADTSMQQARVQGNVATQMKGRAAVLESEIRMDQNSGADTKDKEAALADLQARSQSAAEAQISTLADAGKVLKATLKEDGLAENKEEDNTDNETSITSSDKKIKAEASATEPAQTDPAAIPYTPVDVRL